MNLKVENVNVHSYTHCTLFNDDARTGYVFRGRGQSSLPMQSTAAQLEAHVDELMDEPPRSAGGDGDAVGKGSDGDVAGESIDYGTGAEDYLNGEPVGSGCGSRKRKRGQQQVLQDFRPRPTDYLQAFSHFSYAHTDRKMLVCDLQGVRSDCSPDNPNLAGRFELTGECFAVFFTHLASCRCLLFQGKQQKCIKSVFLKKKTAVRDKLFVAVLSRRTHVFIVQRHFFCCVERWQSIGTNRGENPRPNYRQLFKSLVWNQSDRLGAGVIQLDGK